MKANITRLLLVAVTGLSPNVFAAHYQLKVTNGGAMPISPAAVYVSDTESTSASIGMPPTAGFIKLCQTGNPEMRLSELDKEANVSATYRSTTLLMPGMSEVFDLEIRNIRDSQIHFEGMYGKSKDSCATFTINNKLLQSLAMKRDVTGRDNIVSTGAFSDPLLPMSETTMSACANQSSAVNCLRSLAQPKIQMATIRAFPGYLPSVLSAIEYSFGGMEAQSLIIPNGGAVYYQVKKMN